MHVQLTPENTAKMLKASGELGKSVNEIVNKVIAALDLVHVTEEIKLDFTTQPKTEDAPEKKTRVTQTKNWVTDY